MTYDIVIYRVHERPPRGWGARESLPSSRLLGLEEFAEVMLLGTEIGVFLPGHVDLQVTPDPRKRMSICAEVHGVQSVSGLSAP
jgi:hypothetical protein